MPLSQASRRRRSGEMRDHLLPPRGSNGRTRSHEIEAASADVATQRRGRSAGHGVLRHAFGVTPFDRVGWRHGLEPRLTKPTHPWTNGQAERMNRTIKEATVKRFHDDTYERRLVGGWAGALHLMPGNGGTAGIGACTSVGLGIRIGVRTIGRILPTPIGLTGSVSVGNPTSPIVWAAGGTVGCIPT